ncbi:MAG TPA: I78 family peptidase inhibitor [Micavibrio sp.]|jgi:hypothetical protein
MDKKQKLRIVVIFPVIAVTLILGGVIYGVLQSAIPATAGEEHAAAKEVPAAADQAPSPSCAFDFLVGQTSEQAEAQIKPLDRPYRILKPGDMATQDYSADRINLNIDEKGVVASVNCG